MPRVKKISDEQVLDQALAVLLEQGPHGVTLPAVGRAVGLSPSTLIQRFGSKSGLMDRVFERATQVLKTELEERDDSADPRGGLVDLMVTQAGALRTRAHVAGNLGLLIEDLTDDRRRAGAQRHMAVMRDGIEVRLRAMGSPRVSAHAAALEAHWSGLVLQWALQDQEPDLEVWLRRGLGELLELLVPAA